MNQPTRRLAAVLLVAFALLVVDLTYLQVIAGPAYRDDPRNPRVALTRTGRERGPILSADGEVLAESVAASDEPPRFVRRYPHGPLYAHMVGYSSLLFGDVGLEAAYASELLSGRDPTISGLIEALLGDLRPKGLRLSIVHGLQDEAAEALGDQPGAIVALDPATGGVLAMVSSPSFDPNLLAEAEQPEQGEELTEDPEEPLLNRATSESYAPGSSFKVVTAAAALESGAYNAESSFPNPVDLDLPGSTAVIRNFDRTTCGDGSRVTFTQAFVRSCNTIFAALGMELGAEVMVERAEAFGFNQEIPFELPTLTAEFPTQFRDDLPALAQSSIGQRDVQATALQMALVASGVANDGVVVAPYLVAEVFSQEGEVVRTTEVTEWRRATSPATALAMADLMERVVTAGTGGRAAIPGVRVAGKTGTAQVPDAPPHAWFVGFAPVEMPEVVVAVVVENGGEAGESATGGGVAAPIARVVMERALSD